MCGRFYIPPDDDESGFEAIMAQVKRIFGNSPALSEMKRGEIFPTEIVPVVTAEAPSLMKWGFTRFDGKGVIINARLETAGEKPMFKKAFDTRRCLIPARHYFEWRKDGTAKTKYAIGTDAPIYMAGIYTFDKDAHLPLFVILTRPAAPGLSFIHDRMPVILPEHIRRKWLSEPVGTEELLSASEENLDYSEAI
ncbi:MAG: SOS response-associated peptidase [Clostridiales bacterium]|nr:SOS response-associated peptidase [Clostridiales bacterium]